MSWIEFPIMKDCKTATSTDKLELLLAQTTSVYVCGQFVLMLEWIFESRKRSADSRRF